MRIPIHHPSLAALLAVPLAVACQAPTGPAASASRPVAVTDDAMLAADKEFVREPFGDQARAAVVRQRALFEMHFRPGSAELTPLGRRDLAILAEAVAEDGGSISVRRGSAGEKLYTSRLETVREGLLAAGVDARRIRLDDAPPGGQGTSTSEAILIRAKIRDQPMPAPSEGEMLSPTGGAPTPVGGAS
jgi:hypothetical protein